MIVQVEYLRIDQFKPVLVTLHNEEDEIPMKDDIVLIDKHKYIVLRRTFEHNFVQRRGFLSNAERTVMETVVTVHIVY